jgi:hypothetical protein
MTHDGIVVTWVTLASNQHQRFTSYAKGSFGRLNQSPGRLSRETPQFARL